MQLEALLISLGITEHTAALSEFRDNLLRENAAALQALTLVKNEERLKAIAAISKSEKPNPRISTGSVPHEVPMWSIRAILDLAGLTPQINSILNDLAEPQRTIVLRAWEYGNYIRRDSPTIAALTLALNKTSAEVDAYFIEAYKLNP